MGAKISNEMKLARKLIEKDGYTQAEAAIKAGITPSAISMAPWYKAHAKKLKEKKHAEKNQTVSIRKKSARAKGGAGS